MLLYLSFFLSLCPTERNPPIEEVIQSGVVPRFVEFLARDDYPQLQVKSKAGYWCLYNLKPLLFFCFPYNDSSYSSLRQLGLSQTLLREHLTTPKS